MSARERVVEGEKMCVYECERMRDVGEGICNRNWGKDKEKDRKSECVFGERQRLQQNEI